MEHHRQVSPFSFVAVDLVVGTCSSFVNVLVGYPLDFLKTRMQMNSSHSLGAVSHMRDIIKKEGMKTLYRGVTSPLLGSSFSGSIYFTSYECARRHFTNHLGKSPQDFLPLYFIYLSGAFAGCVSDIFNIPLEYAKIQVQKERSVGHNERGPLGLLWQLIRQKGILQIYKGSSLQLTRDILGCGCFFSAYELSLRHFTPENQTRKDAPRSAVFIASVSAGVGYWTISYPMDVVKTRYQGDDLKNPKYRNISDCIREIYHQGGSSLFYKGYWVAIARSVIVNMVSLNVYENLHRFGYGILE